MDLGTAFLCAVAFSAGLTIIYGLICVGIKAFRDITSPPSERSYALPSEEKAQVKKHLN